MGVAVSLGATPEAIPLNQAATVECVPPGAFDHISVAIRSPSATAQKTTAGRMYIIHVARNSV
ncbi:hypothetical protein [Endozoicomonas sp. ALB115]|uniref:hypothetical protein n=1 Tax=Endozoicomonas sp. ALB115 TaxID=3403074 RepID=UPI003BB77795